METITLNVGGMTCSGCVASIGRALESKSGVIDVDASLETGQVQVQFNANTINRGGVEAAIEAAGFDIIR